MERQDLSFTFRRVQSGAGRGAAVASRQPSILSTRGFGTQWLLDNPSRTTDVMNALRSPLCVALIAMAMLGSCAAPDTNDTVPIASDSHAPS